MTRRPGRAYRLLAVEAVRDGVRRRVVPVIAAISLLSLLAIDSCTRCATGPITVNGELVDVGATAGWGGALMFVVLGLWTVVLAGVLASDAVAQSAGDGGASLTLARPVGRSAYALARLSGSLAIALAAGALLLTATALLLHLRAGVALGPAVWGLAACAAGAVCVGAFAAVASLVLPQIAAVLLVLVAVGWIASVNLLARLGAELQGVHAALDRLGPPLATALVAAIAPWIEAADASGPALEAGLRLVAWAGAGLAALVLVFRRAELGG